MLTTCRHPHISIACEILSPLHCAPTKSKVQVKFDIGRLRYLLLTIARSMISILCLFTSRNIFCTPRRLSSAPIIIPNIFQITFSCLLYANPMLVKYTEAASTQSQSLLPSLITSSNTSTATYSFPVKTHRTASLYPIHHSGCLLIRHYRGN